MYVIRSAAPAIARLLASAMIALATCGTAPVTSAQLPTSADLQAVTVQDAFDLLMDRYVHELDSAAVLRAGWAELEQEASRRQAVAPGPVPGLSGEREADINALESALSDYVGEVADLPATFVPAHAIIRGMVAAVNEGHTVFLDPPAYADYLDWARGARRYGGIGVRVRGPGLHVAEVYENAPAARAGVRMGDVIDRVDDAVVDGLPDAQAAALLRGAVGSTVEVQVHRTGASAPLALSLQRELVSPAPVAEGLLEGNVGYLRLRSFPEDPSVLTAVDEALDSFDRAGLRGLVVDLRGNAGGRLDTGAAVLSRFLPVGTPLFDERARSGWLERHSATQASVYCAPLVLLVDGGTASMGEIFAAVLREQGASPVVGTTTAGNVAGGKTFALDDGSALEVTVREIVTAGGHVLNGVGVAPDEVVHAPDDAPGDPALERAVALVPEAGQGWSACEPR